MSNEERELREAFQARAAEVPVGRPDEAGLARRLAAARRRRLQARLAGAAAVLVLVLGAVTLVAANDGEPENLVAGPGPSTSTSTVETSAATTEKTVPVETTVTAPPASTTGVAPTTSTTVARTTTAAPLPPLPDDALWPWPGTNVRFAGPEQAASDFARRFLGMATPQLSPPEVSGANATVDVRPLPTAAVRTVLSLRRLDVRGWIVVGCAAPSITVDQPVASATATSPLTVRGRTQAFEGHVDVEVRGDGSTTPIGRSFGTGASDQMEPYEATVTFARPAGPRGTVVVTEPRVDDGTQGPLAATVVRIRF